MALILNKNLELNNGYSGNTIYVRLQYYSNYNNEINVNWNFYKDKNSFIINKNPIQVIGMGNDMAFTYDSGIDGTDVLLIVHNKVILELSKEHILEDDSVIRYIESNQISIVDLP